jgi:hypothetical protein
VNERKPEIVAGLPDDNAHTTSLKRFFSQLIEFHEKTQIYETLCHCHSLLSLVFFLQCPSKRADI